MQFTGGPAGHTSMGPHSASAGPSVSDIGSEPTPLTARPQVSKPMSECGQAASTSTPAPLTPTIVVDPIDLFGVETTPIGRIPFDPSVPIVLAVRPRESDDNDNDEDDIGYADDDTYTDDYGNWHD